MSRTVDPARLRALLGAVDQLLAAAASGEDNHAAEIARADPSCRASARNLANYLAVRTHDLRLLQRSLAALSISSLGRMEGHVGDTLLGVRHLLHALLGDVERDGPVAAVDLEQAGALLEDNTVRLLGPRPLHRQTRIMVTLPAAAATDRAFLRELIDAGTDLVRVNLAHDDPVAWTAMVENARAVAAELERECRVLVDLPGPKLRTGPLEDGVRVLRVRPAKDEFGVVTAPARVRFVDPEHPDPCDPAGSASPTVPFATPLAAEARVGDDLVLVDTRDRKREFAVEVSAGGAIEATTRRTAYVGTGCRVELRRDGERIATGRIGDVPPRPLALALEVGETLIVTRDQTPGRPAADGRPATVPCTLPEVFDAAQTGHRILFDDGEIAGEIVEHGADELRVRITRTPPGGGRLKSEKGINLPDTDLHASALTATDVANLDWVAAHADLVGMSFVQRAADVERLHAELLARGRPDLGVVLKIETLKAFERLPGLLFAALQSPPFGVMVARGDLAVEVGFGRLAEVQEEILWLCEAAHVPVVWATQVLDSMAHTGIPSRAEVTDAGMGVRAESVMLNKGPHIAATVRFLGNVLERMQEHQEKKRSMLRRLRVAGG
ncbi:MAG: pyruvate kinase [Planctomycetes bacterium]|nr:pyruvate kinase [Planctomycetota bacterium]